jgi:predicted RNase H-like nuclease (RuvC/YqgF family)
VIICGIDAGSTVGVAIIDLDGKLIETKSFRNSTAAEIAQYIVSKGSPLLIGSDVPKSEFVRKVASILNCKVIKPDKPISREKKALLGNDFKNEHERDAFFSALFAWSKVHNLIKKIDKRDKEHRNEILKGLKNKRFANIKNASLQLRHNYI